MNNNIPQGWEEISTKTLDIPNGWEEVTQEQTNQNTDQGRQKTGDTLGNKQAKDLEAEKIVQKHLGIKERANAAAINEVFQNSKTKEQFKNDFKSAVKQGKIAGEKDLTDNEIEGMYQSLYTHQNRVNVGAFDKSASAEQKLEMIDTK